MSSDYTLYEQMYLRWIRAGMPCWLQIECRLLHSNAMISDGKHGLYSTATVNTCLINRYTLGICIFDWKAKSRWGNDKRHIRIEKTQRWNDIRCCWGAIFTFNPCLLMDLYSKRFRNPSGCCGACSTNIHPILFIWFRTESSSHRLFVKSWICFTNTNTHTIQF